MRTGKGYFLYNAVLAVALGGIMATGCKRDDGIDNNNVIRTPYSLYFSDRLGALYNTNDGKTFKVVFPTDGFTARSITTSGPNIIWVKNNVHLSEDNGLNFNPTSFNANPQPKWQSMILDVPSHGKVYLASNLGSGGLEFSKDNGKTWEPDAAFAPTATVHSLTQLKNGELYAIENPGARIFQRKTPTSTFDEVVQNTPLPAGANYFLSHFNNAIVAADASGAGGIMYSTNGGVDWYNYNGIPTNQEIYSVAAPLEQVLLAGTDSAGIYRLVGDTFQPSNNGLEPNTKVYGIVGKQDTYKNEIIKQFVYIATNKGIFRSEDLGQNWTLVRPGDYRVIY